MTNVEKNASGVYDSPTFKSTGTNILQTDATSTISVFVRVDEAADWVKADNIKAGDVLTELNLYPGMHVMLSSSKPYSYGYL